MKGASIQVRGSFERPCQLLTGWLHSQVLYALTASCMARLQTGAVRGFLEIFLTSSSLAVFDASALKDGDIVLFRWRICHLSNLPLTSVRTVAPAKTRR